MPRRSSKTSHVLNLLSGSEEQAGENTTEINEPINEQIPLAKPVEPAPGISIIDTTDKGEDPLAQLIHDNLATALEADATIPDSPDISQATMQPIAKAMPPTSQPDDKLFKKEEIVTELNAKNETNALQESSLENAKHSPEPDGSPFEAGDEGELETDVEPSYQYVNVMEHVVKEKVIYFMNEFKMCTCDRCQADATALALTNLPAKYIVVDKFAVSPLLNFYTNKYISQATVEVTKACMEVKDNPRH